MDESAWTLLHVLINRFHSGGAEALQQYLSNPEEVEAFKEAKNSCKDWESAVGGSSRPIQHIHYSWIAPTIARMDPKWQELTVASLPTISSRGCSRMLGINIPDSPPPKIVRSLLLSRLSTQYAEEANRPPLALLNAAAPISDLLAMKKGELVQLIDLFAMQDVAEDIRNIVDKKKLKNLYHHLSKRSQEYLKICLHQKDKSGAPKLGLERWDGDPDALHKLLHLRGLTRLGRALSGTAEDLFWHLTQKLDTGRAKVLKKHYQPEATPDVTANLQKHLVVLIDFLKKQHSE